MDYGMLPPEVNSARIHTGPGPGSLLSAAGLWTEVATELHLAAESCWSTVSALTEGVWMGPTSAVMAAAVAPYVAWLTASATQAEQTASQAKAAADAYEVAFAMTVPPAFVAANRAALAMLIATNVLGQNAPAIAANEAAYYEMWAQDATAMYGYAGSSAAAAAVEPFVAPPSTTDSAGRAAAAAAAAAAESTPPQALSTVPTVLQSLAAPTTPSTPTETLTLLSSLNLLSYPGRFASFPMNFISKALGFTKSTAAAASAPAAGAALAALGSPSPVVISAVTPAVSAGMGQARVVGPMSVPHSWSGSTPLPMTSGVAPLSSTHLGGVNGQAAGISTATPVMPVAATGSRNALAGNPSYALRPTVVPRSPAAG